MRVCRGGCALVVVEQNAVSYGLVLMCKHDRIADVSRERGHGI